MILNAWREVSTDTVLFLRGLLRLTSADALTKISSVESFEFPQGGPIVTPMFETAEPPSASPPEPKPVASSAKSASKDSAPDVVSLNSEDTQQIQARLRDLGFLLGPASGAWDARSRAALRDFKVVNHLANNDILDPQSQEKLTSQIAVRADQSFIGSWSKAPCDSTSKDNLRLTVNSRRIKTSAGSVCEFHDFASDQPGWHVRTTCSQGNQHWKADGKFTLRNKKLIWASEGDVSSYFRCK